MGLYQFMAFLTAHDTVWRTLRADSWGYMHKMSFLSRGGFGAIAFSSKTRASGFLIFTRRI
nr:hypothetical protein [Arthrospira sp. SH-MAG29]